MRRRACPGAAGIGPTICETKELQHKYYYDFRRRACPGAAGIGPTTYETKELQHKYYYKFRRRACSRKAGIGSIICETKELQHKYYYDWEASPSGFAGAQTLMVGMRWQIGRASCRERV